MLGMCFIIKYHQNLLQFPPSLHTSPWIANTCHQLLIRLIARTLLSSTLGNSETHPAVPLLKQRLPMRDTGSRTGTTDVFLGKSPYLDGRVGGGGISEDTFSKANVYVQKVETVCFVFTLSFWGVRPLPHQ